MARKNRQASAYARLSPLRKLLRRLGEEDGELLNEVKKAIDESATEVEQVMRFEAPKRDGDLVQSITSVRGKDGLSAYIGPGMRGAETIRRQTGSYFTTRKYTKTTPSPRTQKNRFQLIKAFWLEFGTKKMPPHPFVGPTKDKTRDNVIRRIDTAVTRTLQRVNSKGIKGGKGSGGSRAA